MHFVDQQLFISVKMLPTLKKNNRGSPARGLFPRRSLTSSQAHKRASNPKRTQLTINSTKAAVASLILVSFNFFFHASLGFTKRQ